MSFQSNRRQSQPDEAGYALPIVIVVITVGALAAVALLGYAAALLRAGEDDADSLLHLYAADAGITEMKRRLQDGRGPAPIEFTFGGIPVNVPTPTSTSGGDMHQLAPMPQAAKAIPLELPNPLDDDYSVTIKSVPSGSVLDVRWEYSTTTEAVTPSGRSGKSAECKSQATSSTDTSPSTYASPCIKVRWPSESEAKETPTSVPCLGTPQDGDPQGYFHYLQGCYEVPDPGGDLEIVFDPGTEEHLLTRPAYPSSPECPNRNGSYFCVTRATGGAAHANAGQEPGYLPALQEVYVVESKAGDMTVTAHIHQVSHWCEGPEEGDIAFEPCNNVTILSWKPYKEDDP